MEVVQEAASEEDAEKEEEDEDVRRKDERKGNDAESLGWSHRSTGFK